MLQEIFDGKIDDVRIYNCALDSIQIDSICNTPPVTVRENVKNHVIDIFPNPTTGMFTVANATGDIQVYDLLGNLVLRSNKKEIDMGNYPSGIYIVRTGEAVRKLILR